jgi:hypothetical protein
MSRSYSLTTLKELVAARLTPDEILDILGWTTYELVEYLNDEIDEYGEEFIKAVE